MVQLSHPYMTTGKTTALTMWIFVGKVMSLLFNTLSRFVIAFLPRSKCLLILWLLSPSARILEPKKIKSVTVTTLSPSICHEVICVCAYIKNKLPWRLRWERIYLQCRRPRFNTSVRKTPGEGNGYLLQYSYLGNPTDRGAWQATAHRVAKSWTQLSS